MSGFRFGAVPTAAIRDRRVGHARLRVLAELSTYADKDGWCFPRQALMAENLGLSRKVVQGHLSGLRKLGYIEVEAQYRDDGGRQANRYRVRLDVEEEAPLIAEGTPPHTTGVAPPHVSVTARTPQENTPREPDRAGAQRVIAECRETLDAARAKDRTPFAEDFAAFYAEYPRKVDRRQALLKYQARRREGIDAALLLDAARHYAASVRQSEARFVKHAATFLAPDGPWTEWEHGPPNQRGTTTSRFDAADNPGWAERHPELAR